ncbi:MAG: glycosyltransferase [Candidatus Binatus sp.]|uniref:glycosyltransferase n=1 Tax=Candidatus Binatus sp. TaxID=2811406 RepID=UPI002716A0D5|nr:glycosyltransferase [Candidatus Binatus sp.]MDO8431276.1 glycosyltransferase [Candidatus Binatus sp.]
MISAVLATYGRLEVLKRTLPTVLQQDIAGNAYEIVVVIDGPDDATYEWLRSLSLEGRLSIVQQERRGLAAARNSGIRKAAGELVLFLDDDLICDQRLVRAHACAHRNGPLVAMGPVLVSEESPRTLATRWVRRASVARAERMLASGPDWPRDIAVCANYSAPRELLLAYGGFDETLVGACEEFDLGIRLRKAGVEFRYLPDAVASEIYVKSADAMVQNDCRARGRNEVRLCRKHPEYRPVSPLAGFDQGSAITRLLRRAAVRAPFSLDEVLAPIYRGAEAASEMGGIAEGIAMRLLEFRRGNALFRSAKQEAGSWRAFEREFSVKLPVLLYHRVGAPSAAIDPELCVSRAAFERQMEWLARWNFATITPSQWFGWISRGTPLPPHAMMLTFDNDSSEMTDYIFPVLGRHGFCAAVFIAAGRIAQGSESASTNGSRARGAITAEQVRSWSARGIEFGVRERRESNLAALRDSELDAEIAASAEDLARVAGARPIAFAYAEGQVPSKIREAVGKVFALGFTDARGFNYLGTDPALLRRIAIRGTDTMLDFACRVRLGMHPLKNNRSDFRAAAISPALLRTESKCR